MPNFAIIENSKVVNVVIAEDDYAASQGWISCVDGVEIGWDYDGTNFVDNRPIPEKITPPAPTKEQLLAQIQALTAKIEAL